MIQTLQKLVELQGLDTEILALGQRMSAIPDTLRKEQGQYENAVRELHKAECARVAAEERGRQVKLDIAADAAQIKQLKDKQGQIRKNLEFQALTTEISNAEEHAVKHTAALEQVGMTLKELDERIAVKKTEVNIQKAALLAQAEEAKKAIVELNVRLRRHRAIRREVEKTVNQDAMALYSRLLKTRAPYVVVPVVDGICTGCNIQLPVNVLSDIMKADRLVICETCARVLYLTEHLGK